MSGQTRIDVPENHRRGITTTLTLFDELLCRVEEWAQGREVRSVLHLERNRLTKAQRSRILAEVAKLRRLLESARRQLGLEPAGHDAAADIWSRCAVFREYVMELESRQLHRYGEVPSDLADYVDSLAPRLLAALDRIIAAVSSSEKKGTF
jgi:hypothetical protein